MDTGIGEDCFGFIIWVISVVGGGIIMMIIVTVYDFLLVYVVEVERGIFIRPCHPPVSTTNATVRRSDDI